MSFNIKNILLTGSSGFIGTNFIKWALNNKIKVTCLKRNSELPTEHSRFLSNNDYNTKNIKWPDEIKNIDLSPYSSILHLAHPKTTQRLNKEDLYNLYIYPLELLLKQINLTAPNCSIIFISTLNSSSSNSSNYQKIKFKMEDLILKSNCTSCILAPGLVYGNGNSGLFSKINSLTKLLPIIPYPYRKTSPIKIQTTSINDLLHTIEVVLKNSSLHNKKKYIIASKQLPFKDFLKSIAISQNKKRVFIPIPEKIIIPLLSLIEKLFKNPPLTLTNYLGIMNHQEVSSSNTEVELSFRIKDFSEGLLELKNENTEYTKEELLLIEGSKLYKALFKHAPSEKTLRRYLDIINKLSHFNEENNITNIINNHLDPEVLELSFKNKDNALRTKNLILCYLAEMELPYNNIFILKRRKTFKGFFILSISSFSYLIKSLRGFIYRLSKHNV